MEKNNLEFYYKQTQTQQEKRKSSLKYLKYILDIRAKGFNSNDIDSIELRRKMYLKIQIDKNRENIYVFVFDQQKNR